MSGKIFGNLDWSIQHAVARRAGGPLRAFRQAKLIIVGPHQLICNQSEERPKNEANQPQNPTKNSNQTAKTRQSEGHRAVLEGLGNLKDSNAGGDRAPGAIE